MVIPERTREVHKVVVPFFLLKLGIIFVSLASVFFLIIGFDYIHVLGRMAENKQLKGENFKLRQEIQPAIGRSDGVAAIMALWANIYTCRRERPVSVDKLTF